MKIVKILVPSLQSFYHQSYINKEISVDELGIQLNGASARTQLPESLLSSLKSNIDDLRCELFFGRVKIDGIFPPSSKVILESNSAAVIKQSLPPKTLIKPQRPTILHRKVQVKSIANTKEGESVNITVASLRVKPHRPAVDKVEPDNDCRASAVFAMKRIPFLKNQLSKNKDQTETKTESVKCTESKLNKPPVPIGIINRSNFRNSLNNICKSVFENADVSDEALTYLSEAIEQFSLSLIEQAATLACHRQETFVTNPMYKKIDDVRSQIKYLRDYDDFQKAQELERQKAELFKAAKSRSKFESVEQQQIKETVRQIQEQDKHLVEYSRANNTALKAIGNKRRISNNEGSGNMNEDVKVMRSFSRLPSDAENQNPGDQGYGKIMVMTRNRSKRIMVKDFELVLDQNIKLKRFKIDK